MQVGRSAYRGFAPAQSYVARTLDKEGDYAAASRWLESAARDGDPSLEDQFARFLASCPLASYRNPSRALAIALEVVRRANVEDEAAHGAGLNTVPREDFFDTLAAAYAANGDFAGAIETQTKVVTMLRDRPKAIAEARKNLARLSDSIRTQRKALAGTPVSDRQAIASAQERLAQQEETLADQQPIQKILETSSGPKAISEAESRFAAYKAGKAWIRH